MESMTIEQIIQYGNEIKKRGKVITNYYHNFKTNNDELFEVYTERNTIVFLYSEKLETANIVIKRGYFISNELDELSSVLKELPKDVVFDYITKDEKFLYDVMQKAGFQEYAVFLRVSKNYKTADMEKQERRRKAMSSIYNEKYGYWAGIEDVDDIMKKITEVFDPKTYHLCSRGELEGYINRRWCMIHRERGEIVSIIIFKIEGIKRYGYYMYNMGDIAVLYSMQRKIFDLDEKNGVSYFYGWADKKNKQALKVNSFYGIEFDGLYDVIYSNGA